MKNSTKTHLSFPDSEMRETGILARFSAWTFLFFLLPLLIIIGSCGELSEYENQQVAQALSDSLLATTESWDVEMEFLEDGQLRLTLTGSYAVTIKHEHRHITKISGPVHIEIYNDEGIADTFVQADSAVHHPRKAEFELFGNVDVDAPEGKELRSDYLKWQREEDRVSTPEFVVFITDSDSIAAQGFFGNTDLTNYTLNEGGGRAVID